MAVCKTNLYLIPNGQYILCWTFMKIGTGSGKFV